MPYMSESFTIKFPRKIAPFKRENSATARRVLGKNCVRKHIHCARRRDGKSKFDLSRPRLIHRARAEGR